MKTRNSIRAVTASLAIVGMIVAAPCVARGLLNLGQHGDIGLNLGGRGIGGVGGVGTLGGVNNVGVGGIGLDLGNDGTRHHRDNNIGLDVGGGNRGLGVGRLGGVGHILGN